jgi:hypothetical protein
MNRKLKWILFLVFIFPLCGYGQDLESIRKRINVQAASCEHVKATLDMAYVENEKLQNAYLILVFREGDSEDQKTLKLRMNATETYYGENSMRSRVLMAIGEATTGLGVVELFVGGKLYQIIAFERNGLCSDPEH